MTSHHDVAVVVARLRTVDYFSDYLMASRSEADADLIDRLRAERKEAADLLEAQAKALSEAKTAIHAGHLMANILFNLSQRGEMNADLRKQMAECQKAFDTAARAFTNAAKEKT